MPTGRDLASGAAGWSDVEQVATDGWSCGGLHGALALGSNQWAA